MRFLYSVLHPASHPFRRGVRRGILTCVEPRLLIVDVAALGAELLSSRGVTTIAGLEVQSADTVFPAVTCTVQASLRTGKSPDEHGMISNGLFHRPLNKAMFWEQSAGLVEGERFWAAARRAGKTVGMLFWQQSMGEQADVILTPAPIHKHGGGLVMDCYSQPPGLYDQLKKTIGRPFSLSRYWGPLARASVGDWIVEATSAVMADAAIAPDLLMTYLPSLDYALQRHGPDGRHADKALARALRQLQKLINAAAANGYDVLLVGDYAIGAVGRAVYPNRLLAEAGLLPLRTIDGRDYLDLPAARAFALVDHEIAHVYVRDPADIPRTRALLETIADVTAPDEGHPHSGELVLRAKPGEWFAYPWWTARKRAPEFATHIDIHNKPGFDPCELFFQCWPPGISQNTSRIGGSHGRLGPDRRIAWASTLDEFSGAKSLLDLVANAERWFNSTL